MYTLLDCIKHKCRDSYVLYITAVHPFSLVLLTHTLLVQTHTHDVSAPCVGRDIQQEEIKKKIKSVHSSETKMKGSDRQLQFSQQINVRVNYFFFIILLNFLFFMNLFAEFYKFFKCRLFNKNSRKSTENVCEQGDITETDQ